jgi:multidrug efflux pump
MTSVSQLGLTGIVLQFDLNRNIDAAARDVQAAINAARSQLPADLPGNPWYRKVNPADAPILIMSLTSDTIPLPKIYDQANSILAQKLAQVPGVGQVCIGGANPAVRVEANPNMLNQVGAGLDAVRSATQNPIMFCTLGSAIPMRTNSRIFRLIASKEMSCAAWTVPWIRPVSCCGKKPLGRP